MKKILQILYPGIGGHSSVAFSLIEADTSPLYMHHLLGYGIEEPSADFKLKAKNIQCDFTSILKKKGIGIKSQITVYETLMKEKPDAIIMHSTSLIFVVWLYSIFHKIRWSAVEHQSNQAKGVKDWLYTFFILLFAPHIVYLTPRYKEEIREKYKYIPAKKIKIIHNGVNLLKYKKMATIDSELIIISMVSRMNILRDHKTLIDAFKILIDKHSNIRLYIAGSGDTYPSYLQYVKELGIEKYVCFTGSIIEEEVISLLNKTHIYIHSSLAETLSTSLLQVMACRVPIIATNIDGINNLLEDEREALLFTSGDVEQLVNKIHLLLSDQKMARKIVDQAYTKVKKQYNNNVMLKEYITLLGI